VGVGLLVDIECAAPLRLDETCGSEIYFGRGPLGAGRLHRHAPGHAGCQNRHPDRERGRAASHLICSQEVTRPRSQWQWTTAGGTNNSKSRRALLLGASLYGQFSTARPARRCDTWPRVPSEISFSKSRQPIKRAIGSIYPSISILPPGGAFGCRAIISLGLYAKGRRVTAAR
jgi:hypothetical protein